MDLPEKARKLGIDSTFYDGQGHKRTAEVQALQIVVDALSVPLEGRFLEGPYVLKKNSAQRALTLPADVQNWQIVGPGGGVLQSGSSHQVDVNLSALTPGVYQLRAGSKSDAHDRTCLVVAPDHAFSGAFDRAWLLAVQLYGVRSERNWGIGDFTDLEALLRWAASAGAAGVGLNPLHALFDDMPDDCSPYSPNSRLFLNPVYIDVTRLPELPADFVTANHKLIDEARSAEFVDYAAVYALKSRALRRAFQEFKSRTTLKRKTAFDEFRQSQGPLLSRFACFEVLRKKHRGAWWNWPAPWNAPDDKTLAELRSGPDALDVEFYEFVQWCAHQQLRTCADLAKELGLTVGLYLDVAVGVKAGGFDAWNEQQAISRQLSVGAPPDILNPAGQDWGLAGYNAAGLEARVFEPFRQMLAASMRYAGAIRLDHVLGLNRLYVIPDGFGPAQGMYIRMPLAAMFGIVAIESDKNCCVVIGEDLGTVPDGFSESLAEWAIWSYRVMIFERDNQGSFKAVDQYPANALVTISTHDLPTYAGWRAAHDLNVKQAIDIDAGESHDARHQAVQQLWDALHRAGHQNMEIDSVLRHLANTPSRLMGVGIEDLLGVVDQANVPGTIDQHPNWRRRLPHSIETWDQRIDSAHLREVLAVRKAAMS